MNDKLADGAHDERPQSGIVVLARVLVFMILVPALLVWLIKLLTE